MGLQLHQIFDPRDAFEKLTRTELEYLARLENREDIIPGMPAPLMRNRFREKRPTRIPRPMLHLHQGVRRIPPYAEWKILAFGEARPIAPEPEVRQVNADDILEQEWRPERRLRPEDLPMGKLKKLVKERGIISARTDKREDLLRKLNEQDASQRDQ